MSIHVIVDSSADLPEELVQQNDIAVIPLRIYDEFGTEYTDRITLTPTELLSRMKNGEQFTSSLPSYESIYEALSQNCEEGNATIYLACSGDLSGTYNFAQVVKLDILEKYPNAIIEVIDSRSVSLGIGVLVVDLLKNIQSGDSLDEVIRKLDDKIQKINHIFTLEDLQYLIRGGRIGKFAGFFGGMLNINPIMEVAEGKFKPLEKVRGRKKALNRIIEMMKLRKSDNQDEAVGIVYGDKDELVVNFIDHLQKSIGTQKLMINSVGSAVGVHTGPSALGIFFLSK